MATDPDLKQPGRLLWIVLIITLFVASVVWIFDPTGPREVPLIKPIVAPPEELLPPSTGAPAADAMPPGAPSLATGRAAATGAPAR